MIKAGDAESVIKSLPGATRKETLAEVLEDTGTDTIVYHVDENIPNLFALSPTVELTSTEAYKSGTLILQDKASCFPAHLLLSSDQEIPHSNSTAIGDIIDACAAPGNKTTHLASIIHSLSLSLSLPNTPKIFACERDPTRSKTLQNMVTKAGATTDQIEVLARQDFLALDPEDARFRSVTHLLLDPSCSGSGILGREDVPRLVLPHDPRSRDEKNGTQGLQVGSSKKRKRKRNGREVEVPTISTETVPLNDDEADVMEEETPSLPPTQASDLTRLQKLSTLQSLIVEHAMKFPAATHITYSTCSIHEIENEGVVRRVLDSGVARGRGWRVLRRGEQSGGLRGWRRRGRGRGRGGEGEGGENGDGNGKVKVDGDDEGNGEILTSEQLEACIRCYPDDEEGTMGFFVCGFVRREGGDLEGRKGEGGSGENGVRQGSRHKQEKKQESENEEHEDREEDEGEDDEWEGFD